jgi:hypothetical protein
MTALGAAVADTQANMIWIQLPRLFLKNIQG